MREIYASEITGCIRNLFLSATCELGEDALCALRHALSTEQSPTGREILGQLIENAALAKQKRRPCCQDTGMAVVFAQIGQDVHIIGDFTEAVNEGVRQAYTGGYLRSSMLTPLGRENTGDNTPAILHVELIPGDTIRLTAAPKGIGSENMSAVKMLTPADGVDGIRAFVLGTVKAAGANPCPPIVLGIGVGGTMEKAAILAKHSLTRELGQPSLLPHLCALEQEILHEINALGIGPMGLGGNVTALAVHIEEFPTHIAGLPVAVNMQCHAYRHKTVVL